MIKLFNSGITGTVKIQHLLFLLLVIAYLPVWDKPAAALPNPVVKINDTVLSGVDLQQDLKEIMPEGMFHK